MITSLTINYEVIMLPFFKNKDKSKKPQYKSIEELYNVRVIGKDKTVVNVTTQIKAYIKDEKTGKILNSKRSVHDLYEDKRAELVKINATENELAEKGNAALAKFKEHRELARQYIAEYRVYKAQHAELQPIKERKKKDMCKNIFYKVGGEWGNHSDSDTDNEQEKPKDTSLYPQLPMSNLK
jgi:hypothetical protein